MIFLNAAVAHLYIAWLWWPVGLTYAHGSHRTVINEELLSSYHPLGKERGNRPRGSDFLCQCLLMGNFIGIYCLVFAANVQGIPLDHLALVAKGPCIPGSHGTVAIEETVLGRLPFPEHCSNSRLRQTDTQPCLVFL